MDFVRAVISYHTPGENIFGLHCNIVPCKNHFHLLFQTTIWYKHTHIFSNMAPKLKWNNLRNDPSMKMRYACFFIVFLLLFHFYVETLTISRLGLLTSMRSYLISWHSWIYNVNVKLSFHIFQGKKH